MLPLCHVIFVFFAQGGDSPSAFVSLGLPGRTCRGRDSCGRSCAGPVVSRTGVSREVTWISALACPGAAKARSAIAERTADQREPRLLCVQSEPQNLSGRRTLSGQSLPVHQNRHVACKLPAICPRIWATKSLVTSTWQSNDVSGLLTASTRPSPYG